ncbi:MAG TPA: HIRAN domain-containing protein [Rhodocyclaceae bacterium]|nr:HIRAN domain-containing protein [Rhodocyclaceae bacterium]
MRFASISLLLWALGSPLLAAEAFPPGSVRILVQSSPLAGSQYYRLDELQRDIRVGDTLELVREPDNRHDKNAVSVRWRGQALGYLPRKENRAVAKAIDDGESVRATVEKLTADADPWKRLRVSVFIEL